MSTRILNIEMTTDKRKTVCSLCDQVILGRALQAYIKVQFIGYRTGKVKRICQNCLVGMTDKLVIENKHIRNQHEPSTTDGLLQNRTS